MLSDQTRRLAEAFQTNTPEAALSLLPWEWHEPLVLLRMIYPNFLPSLLPLAVRLAAWRASEEFEAEDFIRVARELCRPQTAAGIQFEGQLHQRIAEQLVAVKEVRREREREAERKREADRVKAAVAGDKDKVKEILTEFKLRMAIGGDDENTGDSRAIGRRR